ncbi:MAG: histidine kinase [Sulfuriferula sp.]
MLPFAQNTIDVAWLLTVLNGSFSEIYFIDCESKQILHANESAQKNLQYDLNDLQAKTQFDISPLLSANILDGLLANLGNDPQQMMTVETINRSCDGSTYPIAFRLFRSPGSSRAYIAIGNDLSQQKSNAAALQLSETRFQNIVANIPGLVFQLLRLADNTLAFSYVSDRCPDLLDITSRALMDNPALFEELIVPEDRANYLASMQQSASSLQTWNWKGQLWIAAWQDIKWVAIRATPALQKDGSILWNGVVTNVTQTKHEEIEVKQTQAQMAELSSHTEKIKEQERTRIAREVHDELGGNLTAIKMAVTLVKRRLAPEDSCLEKINYIDMLADRTIESVRRIASDLRPSILDLGIVAAIEWQAREFERQMGIPCEFISSDDDIELNSDQATALFRVFQEALTNISKHAHATLVHVHLKKQDATITLAVEDNGNGMEQSDRLKLKSFGIRGMMERVNSLGGQLSIKSSVDTGTTIFIEIPLTSE